MHPEGLAKSTGNVLIKLTKLKNIGQFYLAGGTACAVHFGHRYSQDLDFFTEETFNHLSLADDLSRLGKFQSETLEEETILGHLNGVKVSFFRYRYRLIAKPIDYQGMAVSDVPDLAAMKIEAISSRGSKRDFIDVYFMIQKTGLGLDEVIRYFQKKYAKLDHNLIHVVKSLVYFNDADQDELPEMIIPVKWSEVKRYFESEVPRATEKLLGR